MNANTSYKTIANTLTKKMSLRIEHRKKQSKKLKHNENQVQ